MARREKLKPYKGERLRFEGVLIHTIKPNKRNNSTYGLVFASLYASNEHIELDHAVIRMNKTTFKQAQMTIGKRYSFTAEVKPYKKIQKVAGVHAQSEHFMLQGINIDKMYEIKTSHIKQPTCYVQQSAVEIIRSERIEMSVRELIKKAVQYDNDGSVEMFMNRLSGETIRRKIYDKYDIMDVLYTSDQP